MTARSVRARDASDNAVGAERRRDIPERVKNGETLCLIVSRPRRVLMQRLPARRIGGRRGVRIVADAPTRVAAQQAAVFAAR